MINKKNGVFLEDQVSKEEAAYDLEAGTFEVKVGLVNILKGGVLMTVRSSEEAKIAEEAGAVAVIVQNCDLSCATHSPSLIHEVQEAVSIPVMVPCRIGHFIEAQILETFFVDFIDESERLAKVDNEHCIDKSAFRIPFCCGCSDLGEALRRISEGAAFVRTKYCDGNIADVVATVRRIVRGVRSIASMDHSELMAEAERLRAPLALVEAVAESGKLPVPLFAYGGITRATDVALLMALGVEAVMTDAQVFDDADSVNRAKRVVAAATYYRDAEMLAKISSGCIEVTPKVSNEETENVKMLSQEGW